jgi:hypothetical protein
MDASRAQDAPALRVRSVGSTAQILRAHFVRHNVRVLLVATVTLFAAVAAWLLLYFVSTWVVIVLLATADIHVTRIPQGYTILFAVAMTCALVYTWIDRRLTPNERPRDEMRPGDIAMDFLLVIPRLTLSIGGTLAAWQWLSTRDCELAAGLLHHIAEEKQIPMSSVRLDIPDPKAANRILFALQITQVIDVHREDQEFSLRLNALRPASLRLGRKSYADA